MISKMIHYCWFGKNPKPAFVEDCIRSWRKFHPDYRIVEWNEDNFDVNQHPFVKEAYERGMWAFVSDFARVKVIHEYGGFYLDTDMEVTRSLEDLRHHRVICGYELKGRPFSAFFAARSGEPFIKEMIDYYENQSEFKLLSNTTVFSKLLIEKYGASTDDEYQELENGITVFPSHYFSLDVPKNYVIHHFEGSWLNTKHKSTYKEMVNLYGNLKPIVEMKNGKVVMKDLIQNRKVFTPDQILDQIPLKYLVEYVKNRLMQKLKLK